MFGAATKIANAIGRAGVASEGAKAYARSTAGAVGNTVKDPTVLKNAALGAGVAGVGGAMAADVMDNSDATPVETPLDGGKVKISLDKESAHLQDFVNFYGRFGKPIEDEEGNITFVLTAKEYARVKGS